MTRSQYLVTCIIGVVGWVAAGILMGRVSIYSTILGVIIALPFEMLHRWITGREML